MPPTKIYLIQPPILYHSIRIENHPIVPLGMSLLVGALRKRGWDVSCFDINIDMKNVNASAQKLHQQIFPRILSGAEYESIIQFIQEGKTCPFVDRIAQSYREKYVLEDAVMVGISVYDAAQFLWGLFIARLIGESAPVLFGGAFFTAMGSAYFDQFDLMKYLVVGPGEESICDFVEFLQGKRLVSEVSGLLYKKDGKILKNSQRAFKMADAFFPELAFFDLDKYKMSLGSKELLLLPYRISAGCFNHCSFCSDRLANRFQYKPVEKVIPELEELAKLCSTNLFIFADSNLFFSYDYLMAFCDALIDRNDSFLWGSMSGIVDAKGRVMDRALIRKMKASGCRWFALGFETGSDVLRKKMGKEFTAEQTRQVLKLCHEEGINVIFYFMVGYPGETKEDINQTIDFIKKHGRYITLATTTTFHVPYGSPMFLNPEQHGIRIIKPLKRRVLFKPTYEFVEVEGASYADHQRIVSKHLRKVVKATYYYITRDHFRINKYIPFWAYALVKNIRTKNNGMTVLINILLKFLRPDLRKTYQYPYLLKFGLLDEKKQEDLAQ